MRFPSCLQNQILENPSLILVARPWALQAVFQQPVEQAQKKPSPEARLFSRIMEDIFSLDSGYDYAPGSRQ
jgi:hypothetical protein